MKSLVEEASSIFKAVEKAWNRAGKPQSFSVKIFEEQETNFIGMVKKPAKVGIFFEELISNKAKDSIPKSNEIHNRKNRYNDDLSKQNNNRSHNESAKQQASDDNNHAAIITRDSENNQRNSDRRSHNHDNKTRKYGESKHSGSEEHKDRRPRYAKNNNKKPNDVQNSSYSERNQVNVEEVPLNNKQENIPTITPVVAPQQSFERRILKVSSRCYNGQKSEVKNIDKDISSSDK